MIGLCVHFVYFALFGEAYLTPVNMSTHQEHSSPSRSPTPTPRRPVTPSANLSHVPISSGDMIALSRIIVVLWDSLTFGFRQLPLFSHFSLPLFVDCIHNTVKNLFRLNYALTMIEMPRPLLDAVDRCITLCLNRLLPIVDLSQSVLDLVPDQDPIKTDYSVTSAPQISRQRKQIEDIRQTSRLVEMLIPTTPTLTSSPSSTQLDNSPARHVADRHRASLALLKSPLTASSTDATTKITITMAQREVLRRLFTPAHIWTTSRHESSTILVLMYDRMHLLEEAKFFK